MDHKPAKTKDGNLRFTWNNQHISPLAATPANIKAEFKVAGIYPSRNTEKGGQRCILESACE
jgi:hypothetical protein